MHEGFNIRFKGMQVFIAIFLVVWMIGCSAEDPSSPSGDPEVVRKSIEPPPFPVSMDVEAEDNGEPAPSLMRPLASKVTPSEESFAEDSATARGESRFLGADLEADTTSLPEAKDGAAHAESQPNDRLYTVLPGDSLAVIAGREDVLGDPLKWIVLYQLNRDKLEGLVLDERLPERPLPEGLRLRYSLTEGEIKRLDPASDHAWVVNVVSSLTADRIDGPAARLLGQGYPVYISRAVVEGRNWMRLRVGFFKDRESALNEWNKLKEVLEQEESWPVKIGSEERAEYADLLMPVYLFYGPS